MNQITVRCLTAFAVALLITFAVTPLVKRLAVWRGAVRKPRERDMHTMPMPLWGGVAIWLGAVVAPVAVLGGHLSRPLWGVLIAATLVAVLGMLDDILDLSPLRQAAGIVAAALVMTRFGVRIDFVSDPRGQGFLYTGALAVPATVAWMFSVTKAIDFLDGLDGLAAGLSAIAAGTLALMALGTHQPPLAVLAAAVSGACVGFLRHNFSPARIFMGTVGAQFLGFMLAAISVYGLFKIAAAVALALPLLVLGVPIFDAVLVTTRRTMRGRSLTGADKSHVHHLLVRRGLSQRQAVVVLYSVALCLSVIALCVFSRVVP